MRKFLSFIMLLLVIFMTGCDKKVVIRTMESTHQELNIINHIIATLIERDTCIKVDFKPGNASVSIVHEAMVRGDIDFTANYTGTLFTTILHKEFTQEYNDSKIMYDEVTSTIYDKYNFISSGRLGFNDTYALAIRSDSGISVNTISELSKISSTLSVLADSDFYNRDGILSFNTMNDTYNLKWKLSKPVDYSIMYQAIDAKEVDAIVAYTTDPRVNKIGLKCLVDDKNIFPPYDGLIYFRSEVLENHYVLYKYLHILDGLLSDELVCEMNSMLDNYSVEEVADLYTYKLNL